MLKIILYFVGLIAFSYGTDIGNRAKLIDPNYFFADVVQDTIYELEEREWCNLQMGDITLTLNDITHTNIHLVGQVKYTNGFLVSVEKIDITNVISNMNTRTANGEVIVTASLNGRVNLMDVRIGYDVAVNLTDSDDILHYTGVFTHSSIVFSFTLMKNFNTDEITISSLMTNLAAGTGVRMVYLPSDAISEVLSLGFLGFYNWDGVESWLKEIIEPTMLNIARHKTFPEVCFNC